MSGALAARKCAAASELTALATTQPRGSSDTFKHRQRTAPRIFELLGSFTARPSPSTFTAVRGYDRVRRVCTARPREEGPDPFEDREAAERIEKCRGLGEDCLSVQGVAGRLPAAQ